MMLSGFKSKQPLPSPRAVPNGGLGGCIEMRNDSSGLEHGSHSDMARQKVRRKPQAIQIHRSERPRGMVASPMQRTDGSGPPTPMTPMTSKSLPTPSIARDDFRGPSPHQLWDKCKDNPWLATVPKKQHSSMLPPRRHYAPVAELAGSLLLPSQGFVQSNPPTPPHWDKPLRSGGTSTTPSPPPSLTYSARSTPEPRPELQSAFGSPMYQVRPQASSLTISTTESRCKPFALMDAEQLLLVLPGLEAWEILDQWMPAMEKEIAKLRGYVVSTKDNSTTRLAALRPFCDEVQAILAQARTMSEAHSEEFRHAQKSTDPNHESDAIKITRIHAKIRDMTLLLPTATSQVDGNSAQLEKTRKALLHSIQILSGFVRNQMTYQLHYQGGGLSDTLVKLLRDFDCGPPARWHGTNLSPVHEMPNEPSPAVYRTHELPLPSKLSQETTVAVSDSNEVQDSEVVLEFFEDESMKLQPTDTSAPYTTTNTTSTMTTTTTTTTTAGVESQEIIDSYFDHHSISSISDTISEEDIQRQGEMIELDRELVHIRETFFRAQHANRLQHTSTSPTTATTTIPAPQLPSSSSPPATATATLTLEHELEKLEHHYTSELTLRDCQIDDLNRKYENLETQNQQLRYNLERLIRQVERVEALTSPVAASAATSFANASTMRSATVPVPVPVISYPPPPLRHASVGYPESRGGVGGFGFENVVGATLGKG